ncbi:hypothetical protein OS493_039703, partial [Desmophyllum pertusum]
SRGLDANLTRAAFRAAEWLRNNQTNKYLRGGAREWFAFHALRLNKLDKYPQVGFNHPFQYSLAVIALLLALERCWKDKYVNYIVHNIANQTAAAHASGDTLSMHIFALTCAKEFAKKERKFWLLRRIPDGINNASKVLIAFSFFFTAAVGESKVIRVCVELKFNVSGNYSNGRSPPSPVCVEVLNGTNAHEILKMAATQDPCYNFTAVKTCGDTAFIPFAGSIGDLPTRSTG